MPILIGLVGKKFSGKDTMGKYMTQAYNFKRISFADRLKEHCKIRYGFEDAQLEELKDIVDEKWGFTPRKTFKDTGMRFREVDPDYWVNQVQFDIVTNDDDNIVVTDVRFQNEADMIRKNGGFLIGVSRYSRDTDTHVSETSLDEIKVDHIVFNNDSIESLNIQVDKLMSAMVNI